jgi:hypothetical protein
MAAVRSDVSEEGIASVIRVKIINKLGTMLAITRFLLEPCGVKFQKTAFFIVTAMKT